MKMMKNNPIFIYYWLDKGYSLENAQNKVNPISKDFRLGEHYHIKTKQKIGETVRRKYKETTVYDKHLIDLGNIMISKEEVVFFEYIMSFISEIQYKKFIINIKNVSDKSVKIYDGYLKFNENNIILIEYDGTYWHKPEVDEEIDNMVLNHRLDIKGVIRVNDVYFKNNKTIIIKEIENAIEKIKNNKERICRLWE